MTDKQKEDLLWELADSHPDRDTTPPSEETLEAFRQGLLPERERIRVEWLLCRSAAARQKLLETHAGRLNRPPAWIEDRLLRGVESRRRRRRRLPSKGWWFAAASAAMLALAAWLWLAPGPAERLAYDLRIEGISDVRSGTAGSRAHPRTRLRLWVEPEGVAPGSVQFGLYRLEGTRLRRVPPGDLLDVQVARGAARFEVRAETLVGASPGRRDAYVVVTRRGRSLPASIALAQGSPVARLEAATGGTALKTTIEVVPELERPTEREEGP